MGFVQPDASVEPGGNTEERGILGRLKGVEGRVLCECVFRICVWRVVKMNLSIRQLE